MGLSVHGLRFLLYARKRGVDFSRSAMIGRQSLDLRARELESALRAFGHRVADGTRAALAGDGYAEGLFRWLGAQEVHSFDISAHEGATHLHDLNQPLPEAARGRYSAVLDGGSLEHIFDFPAAIGNCMDMLQVGGHYLAITPANNFMGHGFYQFSPELYYRVFTPDNGFEMLRMAAFEDRPGATWYSVANPLDAGRAVTLINARPVMLLVLARKTAQRPVFRATPQQTAYRAPAPRGFAERAKASLPRPLAWWLYRVFRRGARGFDPRLFSPFDPTR